MDLYRLRDPDEFEGLGLRDFSPDHSWWIIEWPEHGQGYLPAPTLGLSLAIRGSGRRLTLQREALPDADYEVLSSVLRSEERRVGEECGSTCRSRWSPYQ